MALTEGKENAKKNETVKTDFEKLAESLQAQILELKKNQAQAPAVVNAGGLSGEQFQTLLKETLKAAKNEKDSGFDVAIDYDQIDQDDYLDEAVKFTAPQVFKVIVEDIKQNRRIRLPNNKKSIEFKHVGMMIVKDENGRMRQNNISRYFSHSKKEVAFLRAHWEYGINFYESDKEAMNADGIKLVKMARIFQGLHSMESTKIFGIAKEYGLPFNDDIQVTKKKLAEKMCEREMDFERGFTEKTVAESEKHKILFKEVEQGCK